MRGRPTVPSPVSARTGMSEGAYRRRPLHVARCDRPRSVATDPGWTPPTPRSLVRNGHLAGSADASLTSKGYAIQIPSVPAKLLSRRRFRTAQVEREPEYD